MTKPQPADRIVIAGGSGFLGLNLARHLRKLDCEVVVLSSWMVRLGARYVIRTDPELALYGRYCVSRRLQEEGFEFSFPDLAQALDNLFPSGTSGEVGGI